MYEYRAYVKKVYDGDTITVDIDLGFNIILHKQKDKKGMYGRWIGEIWLEDECVNDWLLSEGLAEEYGK